MLLSEESLNVYESVTDYDQLSYKVESNLWHLYERAGGFVDSFGGRKYSFL